MHGDKIHVDMKHYRPVARFAETAGGRQGSGTRPMEVAEDGVDNQLGRGEVALAISTAAQ